MGRFRLAAISALALGLAATSVATFVATSPALASSNVTVRLKASEAKGAPVVKSVRLYGSSHALVIGIDNYTNGWPRLTNAVKDARLVAKALREKGFEVTLRTNLKAAEMERAFKEFYIIKGEKADARLFLWFAGHGYTEGGEGYLVPADAPKPQSKARFRLKALSLRRVGDFVRLADSKHAFAVFDSCFSGTVFDSARSMPPVAITKATTLPVRQFLSSGDAGQTVSDNGTFRELFLRALRGEERADANGDGYVTASEIGLFMTDRMTNLTASRQTPRYGKLRDKDFDRGDFVFTLPSAAGDGVDPETVFWRMAERSGERAGYAAYLQQYPGGKFAAAAQVKLEGFRRQPRQSAEVERQLAALQAEREKLKQESAQRQAESAQREAEFAAERGKLAAEKKRLEQLAAATPQHTATAPGAVRPWIPDKPAEYMPLPVGTRATFDNWAFKVEESDGFETVVRTKSNDFATYYGSIAVLGENIYSIWGSRASGALGALDPMLTMDLNVEKAIRGIWPLKVGNRVQYVVAEYAFGGGWYESMEDSWKFTVNVARAEVISIKGQEYRTYVIETTVKSERGREFSQTHWYHPDSGLIIKLVRKWVGKLVERENSYPAPPQPRVDTDPGDVQAYELLHATFPKGAKNALAQ